MSFCLSLPRSIYFRRPCLWNFLTLSPPFWLFKVSLSPRCVIPFFDKGWSPKTGFFALASCKLTLTTSEYFLFFIPYWSLSISPLSPPTDPQIFRWSFFLQFDLRGPLQDTTPIFEPCVSTLLSVFCPSPFPLRTGLANYSFFFQVRSI